jgi:hypothetical protein
MEPRADGLKIHPNLPSGWPGLTVTRIDFHSMVCDITVAEGRIRMAAKGGLRSAFNLHVPAGQWRVRYRDDAGRVLNESVVDVADDDGFIAIKESQARILDLIKIQKGGRPRS